MQFNGTMTKIGKDRVEFMISGEENKDVVAQELLKYRGRLVTIHLDHEYNITLPQRRKLKSLIKEISENMDIDQDVDKEYVAEEFLKKRFGLEDIYAGTKEETSILIEDIHVFCDENSIPVYQSPHDHNDINKMVNASIKKKSCVICAEPGTSVELSSFNSKLISEFRMGYRFVSVCSNHYMEIINTGVAFFKKYHLIKSRDRHA